MKLQLASDLHLEFLQASFPAETLIRPVPGADVLVLAGDIHLGTRAVDLFADWPVPVLYVAGNHEFYGHEWMPTRKSLRDACAGTAIRFLDNDQVDIDGTRFLGCTLWTDFTSRGVIQERAMDYVEQHLNDYFEISTGNRNLRACETLDDHIDSRQWLWTRLAQPYEGPTVVITHHAPHPLSIHQRFVDSPLNPGFVSDMTEGLLHADLWLHGHVHDSFDYRVGRCRVVANPAGYVPNPASLHSMADIELENQSFIPDLVLEIGHS
jgi:predicted phosphodiesterase